MLKKSLKLLTADLATDLYDKFFLFLFFLLLCFESLFSLELYYNKEAVEKAIGNIKEQLNMRRAHTFMDAGIPQ